MESYFDWILQNPGLNHITIKIFEILDVISLDNCLEVSQQWFKFIIKNTSIWNQHASMHFPLHNACLLGHVTKVKLLIELDYDINATNKDGKTPLYLACKQNHVKVVKFLCQQPRIVVNAKKCCSPIFRAYLDNNIEIFEILLNHPKTDVNFVCQATFGTTILHHAYSEGNLNIVELLCQHPNINVNFKNNFGTTPLMIACLQDELISDDSDVRLRFKIFKTLCEHPSIDVNATNQFGDTALHYACLYGKLNHVKLLLEHPFIDIKMLNKSGKTPIDLAKLFGHQNIMNLFCADSEHQCETQENARKPQEPPQEPPQETPQETLQETIQEKSQENHEIPKIIPQGTAQEIPQGNRREIPNKTEGSARTRMTTTYSFLGPRARSRSKRKAASLRKTIIFGDL